MCHIRGTQLSMSPAFSHPWPAQALGAGWSSGAGTQLSLHESKT